MDDKKKKPPSETNESNTDKQKSFRRSWKTSGPVAKVAAIGAVIAAVATASYAIASWWQWYDTRYYFERDLRPYVIASGYKMAGEFKDGVPFWGEVEIINSGRTPAVSLHACASLVIRRSSEPITDEFPCPTPPEEKVRPQPGSLSIVPHIQPADTSENSTFALGSNVPLKLSSQRTEVSPINLMLQALSDRAIKIYVYGDVSYSSIERPDVTHRTLFCGRYNSDTKGFDACEHHNRMD
jgi:hypothetical protein